MILFFNATIQELKVPGMKFTSPRPLCHMGCKSKVWGHGHVRRFFNGINGFILLKRWRCSSCKSVITCRPKLFWRRYQESIENIFDALKYRASNLTWPPWISRQRGGHWMNKLFQKAKINLMVKASLLATIIFFQEKNLSIN